MKITSLDNARIKSVGRLRERKERDETGLTVIDGMREVMRAQEAGIEFTEVYFCPEMSPGRQLEVLGKTLSEKKVPCHEVTREIYHKIAFGDRKEGVVAVCRPRLSSLEKLKKSKNPLLVIAENIEKPGNLGAILRTCDGAGVDAFLMSDKRTDIFNPNVIRASIGAVFSVPVVQAGAEDLLAFLRQRHIRIMATSPEGEKMYANVNLNGPLAVVVGCEQTGLSEFWLKNADAKLRIPMHGKADSLNVSITTAIIIYEALRQRQMETLT